MSVPTARRRLPALLALLRANGVTSYDDGAVKLTLTVQRAEVQSEEAAFIPGAPKGQPRKRVTRDAVDLAIRGIDYDPDAAEPRESDA